MRHHRSTIQSLAGLARVRPALLLAVIPLLAILATSSASGGVVVAPVPAPVNVLQDCWTTDLQADPDPEKELYTFTTDDSIQFIWKYKLLVSCSAYRFRILGYDCVDGKPPVFGSPIRFLSPSIGLGQISPVPGIPELLFLHIFAPGSIPPGRYDWVLITECDDTNGANTLDGDIDDTCGLNAGMLPITGTPVIMGPEPVGIGDRDPGGSPPGRVPGEDGVTRPWCFEVEQACEASQGPCIFPAVANDCCSGWRDEDDSLCCDPIT